MTDIVQEPEVVEEQIQDVSKDDELAMSRGWRPKDKFEGNPDDWRDAKTFLEKGELLDAIHSLKKQSKDNKETIEKLVKQQSLIAEESYNRALEDVRLKHKEAVQIGDVEAAGKAAQQMIDLAKKDTTPVPQFDPEIAQFVERNKTWFNHNTPENAAMTVYADKMEQKIRNENPQMSSTSILSAVEADVKKNFSRYFQSNTPEVSAVASPKSTPGLSKQTSLSDLPRFQQIMIQKFRREIKNFDEAGYIKQIKSISKGDK